MRDGALRYVAVALVDPDAIHAILQRQRVPADWVISIFDGAGRRVARSRQHAENLGKPGAPSVVDLMARPADEGWGRTIAIEPASVRVRQALAQFAVKHQVAQPLALGEILHGLCQRKAELGRGCG